MTPFNLNPLFPFVVNKLIAEGMAQENFNPDRAKKILSHCIAKTALTKTFENYSQDVYNQLPPTADTAE